MQPITIKNGAFVAELYEVDYFLDLPLANTRKLWKLMFAADYDNRETIAVLRDWLPQAACAAETALDAKDAAVQERKREALAAQSRVAAMGSMVTKKDKEAAQLALHHLREAEDAAKKAKARHEKTIKLQNIFNEIGGF